MKSKSWTACPKKFVKSIAPHRLSPLRAMSATVLKAMVDYARLYQKELAAVGNKVTHVMSTSEVKMYQVADGKTLLPEKEMFLAMQWLNDPPVRVTEYRVRPQVDFEGIAREHFLRDPMEFQIIATGPPVEELWEKHHPVHSVMGSERDWREAFFVNMLARHKIRATKARVVQLDAAFIRLKGLVE